MSTKSKKILEIIQEILKRNKIQVLDAELYKELTIQGYMTTKSSINIDFAKTSKAILSSKITEIVPLVKEIEKIKIVYELVISNGFVLHLNVWSAEGKNLPDVW